jgi:hypothetical protein
VGASVRVIRFALCSQLTTYLFRGCFRAEQRNTIYRLVSLLHNLCASAFRRSELDTLYREAVEVLWLVEQNLPLFFLTISLHLVLHIPATVRDVGPIHAFWLYGAERLFYILRQTLHSKKVPAATVIREYRVLDVVQGHIRQTQELEAKEDLPPMRSLLCSFTAECELQGGGELYFCTPQEVTHLRTFLSANDDGYMDVETRYRAARASGDHRSLSAWIEAHSASLSVAQRFFRFGVCESGTRYRRASLNGILFRGELYEDKLKTSRCGIKAFYLDDHGVRRTCYGRVQYFLHYKPVPLEDCPSVVLAYVHWWRVDGIDPETKLPILLPSAEQTFWPLDAVFPSNILFVPRSRHLAVDSDSRRPHLALDLKSSSAKIWAQLRGHGP